MGQALEIIFQVCGGLGIFLLGMKNMSEGMQAVAGERLRKMIGAVTNNRLMASSVGTLVTCVIQSSSVTTVMVVGMVNASIMTLTQAIGVILGANIGTTITGWILVVKIGKYGLPLLGISAFFYLFSKKDKIRFLAMFLMGLGMVFFGLELMKHGFAPIKEMPGFVEWFHRFTPDTYLGVWKCVLVGALLTAIVQSSSATLGITMALALTGAIDYRTAAALILGENIGTTITAFLASLGAFTNARRAAYAHVIFNLIGVFWITLLFVPYTNLISRIITKTQICDIDAIMVAEGNDTKIKDYAGACDIPEKALYFTDAGGRYVNNQGELLGDETSYVLASDLEKFVDKHRLPDLPLYTMRGVEYPFTQPAIAFTHSGFNIANTLLFLPFIGLLARFLVWLVPDKVAEKPSLTYLNVRMLDTPAIAIEQSYKELTKMGHEVRNMMHMLKRMLSNKEPDRQIAEQLFQKENDLDVIQKEIVEFIGDMMAGNITHEVMHEASNHLRMADELESISDYARSLLKLRLKMRDDMDMKFSDGGLEDLTVLHEKTQEYIDLINDGIERQDNTSDYFSEMQTKGQAVTNFMKECRQRHLARVGDGIATPQMSLIYTDMLTAYRRIKDHAFNIAEVLAGEK